MIGRIAFVVALAACGSSTAPGPVGPVAEDEGPERALKDAREVHFAEVRQLTRGVGENAEAYWSFDGDELIFQSKRAPYECDQIFRMPADGSAPPSLVSTGTGRTTCSYFFPGQERIVYSSTHLTDEACPPTPDFSQGYVWPIYAGYEIFTANPDGSDLTQLTDNDAYDAEATVCAKDGSIIFTSTRDGDLDLYRMDADGSNVVRLTDTPGYDGGAFFSPDCSMIVWRTSRPTGDALADYQRLLAQGLVRPSKLEIWVANADGSEARQVTYLDAASFAPYFFPSGDRILFSSNVGDPSGREFDLWAVDVAGTRLERVTFTEGFDGFPMFSPDGTMLAFGSNRNQENPGETDVYVARWVDEPPAVTEPTAADRVRSDVHWLADPAREGRGVGTAGLDAAADWLEQQYQQIGLAPGYSDDYRQPFDVAVSVERGDGTALAIDGKPVAADAFVPAPGSAAGEAKGRTVFAGYGITDEGLGVDDYRRVNAKGKIVVVRRFTPTEGKFEDEETKRRFGDLRYKAWNARQHGAIGLIVVDTAEDEAPLPALALDRHGDAGIPVVVVKQDAAGRLTKGRRRAAISVALDTQTRPAHNVVGKLEATGAKLPGAIVIGAHYDHLGMGGEGSLAHGESAPHLGADDNASGTAALLEVARTLAGRREALRRDVYFVAFSAEESGILGSNAFVKALPEGLEASQIVAMLNMDMVGRLRNNTLSVLGGESADEWSELVPPACDAVRVRCQLGGDGYGPSDHTPFYAAGVPVLHFFTGAHADYHKPSDAADRVNAIGAARIAHLVADVAQRVGAREQPLTYKQSSTPRPVRGDVRSHGAALGTIPDYSAGDEPGVLLSGVRKDGPAEKAGLQRGDRIVKMGEHDIANIRDMMFVLQKAKPGETTTITVIRDGAPVTLEVTYGHSRRR